MSTETSTATTGTGTTDPTGTGGPSSTSTSTTSTQTGGPAPGNTPPTASLIASIDNGPAPVNVTFTVDGGDEDGDPLNWSLDADADGAPDGEGTEFPATVEFNYTTEGLYNATLTVSDGKESVVDFLVINVTAAVAAEPESVTFSGSTSISVGPTYEQVGGQHCISFETGENGIDCLVFTFEESYDGRNWVTTTDATQTYVDFWDACDVTSGSSLEKGTMAGGAIPAGAGCVVIFENSLAPAGATMTFTVL